MLIDSPLPSLIKKLIINKKAMASKEECGHGVKAAAMVAPLEELAALVSIQVLDLALLVGILLVPSLMILVLLRVLGLMLEVWPVVLVTGQILVREVALVVLAMFLIAVLALGLTVSNGALGKAMVEVQEVVTTGARVAVLVLDQVLVQVKVPVVVEVVSVLVAAPAPVPVLAKGVEAVLALGTAAVEEVLEVVPATAGAVVLVLVAVPVPVPAKGPEAVRAMGTAVVDEVLEVVPVMAGAVVLVLVEAPAPARAPAKEVEMFMAVAQSVGSQSSESLVLPVLVVAVLVVVL